MAITQKSDGRWAVYYRRKGKQVWEYFGRGPAGEAAARQRNMELGLGRRTRKRQLAGPLISDLMWSYYNAQTGMNANSRKMLAIRLEANLIPHFGHLRANQLTDTDVDRYVRKRRLKVKDSTIARELTDLKAILNWATRRRPPLLRANPIRDYTKPREDNAIILPPTQDETARILSVAKPHLRRAIMLAHYTGLRPGATELLTITWDHVDIDGGKLLVVSAEKGGIRQRLVPIHPSFIKVLKEWRTEDKGKGFVINWRGKSIRSFKSTWKTCLNDAMITRRIRPYDLRHAFVTQALESGADIKAVAGIVGSSPETLRKHYQHVTERLRSQAVATIPSLPGTEELTILKSRCIAEKQNKNKNKSNSYNKPQP